MRNKCTLNVCSVYLSYGRGRYNQNFLVFDKANLMAGKRGNPWQIGRRKCHTDIIAKHSSRSFCGETSVRPLSVSSGDTIDGSDFEFPKKQSD
jgi:hypothetical protein